MRTAPSPESGRGTHRGPPAAAGASRPKDPGHAALPLLLLGQLLVAGLDHAGVTVQALVGVRAAKLCEQEGSRGAAGAAW